MKIKISGFLIIMFMMYYLAGAQQPSLTIINKSDRKMSTKIMKGSEKKSQLYSMVYIEPKGKEVVYFSERGRYFTKTMAIFEEKDTLMNDTIYSRGQAFEIVISNRGYTNITMTFTVKESKKPQVQSAIPITRKEYEED